MLSVRALPVPPPRRLSRLSPLLPALSRLCLTRLYISLTRSPPSRRLRSESLHSAQTLPLHRSLSMALPEKTLLTKGAGVNRFPVSWRLADPPTVRRCRVPMMRGAQRQARPSPSSRRCDHNTHRETHTCLPVTACLARSSPVHRLPVSRTSDRRSATVAPLNKTSVSHSALPDWTPTASTVHIEPNAGWVVSLFPLWDSGGGGGGGMQGVAGCISLLTDGGHETPQTEFLFTGVACPGGTWFQMFLVKTFLVVPRRHGLHK